MPFMELNYSTYEATIMLQQSFDFKLKQMQKPANILSRLMGINCDYHKPRKPILRFLVLLHRVFICIFGVFLTLAFLFEILCLYHQHGNDGNSLGRNLFLLLVKFQGLLNFAFILFWNFGHYQEKIRDELLSSSNAIGVIRRSKRMILFSKIIFWYVFIKCLVFLSIYCLLIFTKLLGKGSFEIIPVRSSVQLILFVTTILQLMPIPIAYSIVSLSLMMIASEFLALYEDFREDSNTYQLPVTRHYIAAHHKLLQAFLQFRCIFCFWISSQMFTIWVSILILLYFSDVTKASRDHFILGLFLVESLFILMLKCYISIKVNRILTNLTNYLIDLVASNVPLQEEMARNVLQIRQQIEEIQNDIQLQEDLKILPKNYTFEVPKTIWKIRTTVSKRVALQFPEGLLMYSCVIADLLTKYTDCEVIIMGDVTYGACCVDDYTARALGCDLLVHYGHSCLVPIQETSGIHLLYIFVNIDINLSHLLDIVEANFKPNQKLALVSTIQFVASLQALKRELSDRGYNIMIPQCNPLSPGEILGCTSPKLPDDVDAILYVGDGRFHLESMMIQNPKVEAFQYDPYSRKLTNEKYGFDVMVKNRQSAIETAKKAKRFGLIQGTLGRQGNLKIFDDLEAKLNECGKEFIRVLMSEIFVDKLARFSAVDCWTQVACPRLSIDWGTAFPVPLLTPYELSAALKYTSFSLTEYPMDFYANDSRGPWTNNHESHRPKRTRRHLPIVVNS